MHKKPRLFAPITPSDKIHSVALPNLPQTHSPDSPYLRFLFLCTATSEHRNTQTLMNSSTPSVSGHALLAFHPFFAHNWPLGRVKLLLILITRLTQYYFLRHVLWNGILLGNLKLKAALNLLIRIRTLFLLFEDVVANEANGEIILNYKLAGKEKYLTELKRKLFQPTFPVLHN